MGHHHRHDLFVVHARETLPALRPVSNHVGHESLERRPWSSALVKQWRAIISWVSGSLPIGLLSSTASSSSKNQPSSDTPWGASQTPGLSGSAVALLDQVAPVLH